MCVCVCVCVCIVLRQEKGPHNLCASEGLQSLERGGHLHCVSLRMSGRVMTTLWLFITKRLIKITALFSIYFKSYPKVILQFVRSFCTETHESCGALGYIHTSLWSGTVLSQYTIPLSVRDNISRFFSHIATQLTHVPLAHRTLDSTETKLLKWCFWARWRERETATARTRQTRRRDSFPFPSLFCFIKAHLDAFPRDLPVRML